MVEVILPLELAALLRRTAAAGAVVLVATTAPASAQVVIGGDDGNGDGSAVIVNERVLEGLGPPPERPAGRPLLLTPEETMPPLGATGAEDTAPTATALGGAPLGGAPFVPPLPERKPQRAASPEPAPAPVPRAEAPAGPVAEGPGDLVIPPPPNIPPAPSAATERDAPDTAVVGEPPPEPDLDLTPLPAAPDGTAEPPAAPAAPPEEPELAATPPEREPATGPEIPELAVPPAQSPRDGEPAEQAEAEAGAGAGAGAEAAGTDGEADPLTAMTMPVLGATPEAPSAEERVSIAFDADSVDLTDDAGSVLADLAERLESDESLRLQLFSYAGGTAASAAEARTLSLHRALAVRRFMLDRDIRVTRIDIRALGNSAPGQPADRIDLVLVN